MSFVDVFAVAAPSSWDFLDFIYEGLAVVVLLLALPWALMLLARRLSKPLGRTVGKCAAVLTVVVLFAVAGAVAADTGRPIDWPEVLTSRYGVDVASVRHGVFATDGQVCTLDVEPQFGRSHRATVVCPTSPHG